MNQPTRGFYRVTQVCFEVSGSVFELLSYGEAEDAEGKKNLAAEIASDEAGENYYLCHLKKDGENWCWSSGTPSRVAGSEIGKAVIAFFNSNELTPELQACLNGSMLRHGGLCPTAAKS